MKNAQEQMVSTAVVQSAYIKFLNRAFEKQAPGGNEWKDRLPIPKQLKLRLPRPECRAERDALGLWLSILTERTDVQFDVELV